MCVHYYYFFGEIKMYIIVVYPPKGSTAYIREMSTQPMLLQSMALLYLLPLHQPCYCHLSILLFALFRVFTVLLCIAS